MFRSYYEKHFTAAHVFPKDVRFRHYRFELFGKKTRFIRLRDIFGKPKDVYEKIVHYIPKNAYYMPVKWLNPIYVSKTKTELDIMLSSPLFFDIDMGLLKRTTFSEAKITAIKLIEFICENYSRDPDLVVFSGRQGFHICYWDWDDRKFIQLTPRKRLNEFKRERQKILDELVKNELLVDAKVTRDPYRVLRIPNTLHGRTGLIAKPVEDLDSFRPDKHATAFHEDKYLEVMQTDLRFFCE